jgi:outer membrane lipoprotein-sorting protein
MKKVSMIFALLLTAAFISPAQTADEIVNQYLQNIGGADNLRKINGTKMIAKVNAGGMELPLEMINLKSGKMRMKFDLQGKEIVQQAFDGTTAWGTNFMTMQAEKSDSETTENIKREIGDFPDPFVDYASKGYKIELIGSETVEGTKCHKVKLTKKPQLVEGKEVDNVTFYYFDAESMVPVVSESEIKAGPGKGMISQTIYSDYKEVSGIYFPFSITQKAKGQPEGQTVQITAVELNPKVNDSIFTFGEEKEKKKK